MILISARTKEQAVDIAIRQNLHRNAYIYVPIKDTVERRERLRGIYGLRAIDLIGEFTFLEIETVCRKIGTNENTS